jgi:hypothetical protein
MNWQKNISIIPQEFQTSPWLKPIIDLLQEQAKVIQEQARVIQEQARVIQE